MLNELLALYPEAKADIIARSSTPYIWYRNDKFFWAVTEGGYVSGFDLINDHYFPLTQFDDIAGITGYISTIVKGV